MNQPDTVSFSLQGTIVSLVKADVLKYNWNLAKLIASSSLPFNGSGDTAHYVDVDSAAFKLLWCNLLQSGEDINVVAKRLSGVELSLLIGAATKLECNEIVTSLESIKQGYESELEEVKQSNKDYESSNKKLRTEIHELNTKVVSLEKIFAPITAFTCGNFMCPQVGLSRLIAFGSFSGIANILEEHGGELLCRYCGLAGSPVREDKLTNVQPQQMFICGYCTHINRRLDILYSNSCPTHMTATLPYDSPVLKDENSKIYVCGYCVHTKKRVDFLSSTSCGSCVNVNNVNNVSMFEYRVPNPPYPTNKIVSHDNKLTKDELDFINRHGPTSSSSSSDSSSSK